MHLSPDGCYKAVLARDARFDGVFFVGVTSTGIYCRPVCTAKTPRLANCRFFDSAEAAEKASFRPCLRCRPELAPGSAPVDDPGRIAGLVVHRIEEAMLTGDAGLEAIAAGFELSSRQLRRIVRDELGVSPMELVMTRRLLLAKQLLTGTTLPVTEVAFASGFASLRRFNDAFLHRYGMPPGRLRRRDPGATDPASTITLQLGYRPPYDWGSILAFLGAMLVWAVGLLAFLMLTGRFYWRTANLAEPALAGILKEIFVDPIDPASHRASGRTGPGRNHGLRPRQLAQPQRHHRRALPARRRHRHRCPHRGRATRQAAGTVRGHRQPAWRRRRLWCCLARSRRRCGSCPARQKPTRRCRPIASN